MERSATRTERREGFNQEQQPLT
jgi:hypothetical protein